MFLTFCTLLINGKSSQNTQEVSHNYVTDKNFSGFYYSKKPLSLASKSMFPCRVVRVIDGDTIVIYLEQNMHPLLKTLKVRLRGVDTPEKRTRDKLEKIHGYKATAFVKGVVESGQVFFILSPKWDKYGGRIVADIYVDSRSLAKMLIDNNLAVPYFGGKKIHWGKYLAEQTKRLGS